MPVDPARVKSLFLAASDLNDAVERASFLDRECGDDSELRARVEALLKADESSPNPVEAPVDATGTFDRSVATGDFNKDAATGTFSGSPPNRVPSAVPAANVATGTIIAGRYTLLEIIGEGGMGTVYRASQTEPVKRQVALKLIKPGMDSKGVLARFDAERQALAMMDHPNIARIYDGGITPVGQPFFVMELVKGIPLTDYCDEHRLTVNSRLQLFVAVCQAVQHAHQKGIIHRDLKPSNVLVTEVDGTPTPKVIDFGVAKATEQKLTDMSLLDVGAIVGTPAYMSPEQADPTTSDIDTRTDVYALGVMLYELLAGSPPIDAKQFKRGAIVEMLRMVREVEPPRPSTKLSTADALPNIAANRNIEPSKLAKLLQGELDWVVMKAIEKDRTRRYETASNLGRDIQRYLADELVEARPPSAGYRLKKFVKRHKLQLIAVSLILLALVAGMAGTTIGMLQAREAKEAERLRADGEKQAKEKEAEALLIATSQIDLASETLGDLVGKIQSDLGDVPGGRQIRKEILEDSMKKLQKLYASPATQDRLYRRHGLAHQQMGEILWSMNRRADAEKEYQLAAEFARKALLNNPNSDKAKSNLAAATNRLGDTEYHYKGNTEAARDYYRVSLGLWESLAKKMVAYPDGDPTLPEDERITLLRCDEAVADTYVRVGRLAQDEDYDAAKAADWYTKSLVLRQRNVDSAPTRLHREYICFSYLELISVAPSSDLYRKLLDVRQVLYSERPWSLIAKRDLANAHIKIGFWLQRQRENLESHQHLQRALNLYLQILAAEPTDPLYQSLAAHAYYGSGTGYVRLNQHQEALHAFQEGLKLRQSVYEATQDARQKLNMHPPLMFALARCGKHVEAAELIAKALQLPTLQSEHMREAAACYGICMVSVGAGKPIDQLTPDEKLLRKRYLNLLFTTLDEGRAKGWIDLTHFPVPVQQIDWEPWVTLPEFQPWLDSFQECERLKELLRLGDKPKAVNELRAAIIKQRQAITQHPEIAQLRRDLLQVQGQLIASLILAGKREEASAELQAAMTAREQIATELGTSKVKRVHPIVAESLLFANDPIAARPYAESAVELDPKSAEAHILLGRVRMAQGDVDGANVAFKAALQIDANNTLAKQCLGTVDLLAGRSEPKSMLDVLAYAKICKQSSMSIASVQLYEKAFATEPSRAQDINVAHRYSAACAAVQASRGLGLNAPTDSDKRAELRAKALVWLNADLAPRKVQANATNKADRKTAIDALTKWLKDVDLAETRPGEERTGWTPKEIAAWNSFWSDVKATLTEANKMNLDL